MMHVDITLEPLFFWLISAVIVASGLAVVLLRNIVHSALFLVLTFVGMAGIYGMLEADFLAAVQILVYAGAVSILIVFAVMLTRRNNIKQSNLFNRYSLIAAVTTVAFTAVTGFILLSDGFEVQNAPGQSIVSPVAKAMMGKFVIPFEVAAILLLVALVGAIILARGVKKES